MAVAILRHVDLFGEDPCMRFAEDGEWAYGALKAGAAVYWIRAIRRWLRGVSRGDAELAANSRGYTSRLLPGIIAGMKSSQRPHSLS